MQTKHSFFKQDSQSTLVDLTDSFQETSQLIINPSSQTIPNTIQGNNSSKTKQFIKSFLEQAKGTALGGAALANNAILVLTMMGHKFSIEDHKRFEAFLLTYWGLRGGAAGMLAITGLKDKAPDAIATYVLTEKNIIKILAIFSFLQKMPLSFSIKSTLQIASSCMVVIDQGASAKALVLNKTDPSNCSYPEIKEQYRGQSTCIALVTLKEMFFRAIQLGSSSYTAGYALADTFVDAVSPVDPPNQEKILMILALAMSIFGALCIVHPVSSQIAHQIRSLEINIGLVFLPLVSLMYDYLPQWFSSNSLETGLIALILVGVIPVILEAMVSIWSCQDQLSAEVKPQGEKSSVVEDLIVDQEGIRYD